MSLTMFSAVSRSISSAFFRPTAVWCATACSSSASSSSNDALARHAAEEPELLVAGRERRDQQLVLDGARAAAAHQRHQLRRARPGRAGAVRRIGARQLSSSASGSIRQIWHASAPSSWRAPRVTAS